MSDQEQTTGAAKGTILKYVDEVIQRRDSNTSAASGRPIDKDAIVITSGTESYDPDSAARGNLNERSLSSEIDPTDLNLDPDPVIETQESSGKVYKQQVYLRQYQPPTPEPLDIQVQEVIIKPQAQRPPIHVHVGPNQNRDEPRTPSPILIKSAPPEPLPASDSNEPLVYQRFVPIDHKNAPQQIIIHRYPDPPPKPRPIVVEQWLPNKPAPKRITYRRVDREDFLENEAQRQRNRLIEYTKPHTTIEMEVVRLPVVRISPQEYHSRQSELTRLDQVRSMTKDPSILQWRI